MRWRKMALVALFFSTAGVACVHGQRRFEVTPFGGSRFGGTIEASSSSFDNIRIKSSWDYGVMGDLDVWPNLQAEFSFNRQPTELSGHSIKFATNTDLTSASLDMYQWGFLYSLRPPEARIKPYIAAGLGFTHFDSRGLLGFSNRFSYNLGGGVKYFFTENIGLRMEARWSPSHTTTGQAVYCDPFFGCFLTRVANKAEQGEANLGIIFRFK